MQSGAQVDNNAAVADSAQDVEGAGAGGGSGAGAAGASACRGSNSGTYPNISICIHMYPAQYHGVPELKDISLE